MVKVNFSQRDRIAGNLRRSPKTTATLAMVMGVKPSAITSLLNTMRKRGDIVQMEDGRWRLLPERAGMSGVA